MRQRKGDVRTGDENHWLPRWRPAREHRDIARHQVQKLVGPSAEEAREPLPRSKELPIFRPTAAAADCLATPLQSSGWRETGPGSGQNSAPEFDPTVQAYNSARWSHGVDVEHGRARSRQWATPVARLARPSPDLPHTRFRRADRSRPTPRAWPHHTKCSRRCRRERR